MLRVQPFFLAVLYSFLTSAVPMYDEPADKIIYERQGPGTGGPFGDTTLRTDLGTLNCGCGGGCEKSKMESETIAIGFEAGGGEWITGGFSVTKEYPTGETDTCYGEDGETLCIWQRVHHTACTVEETESNRCNGVQKRQFVMKYPE
ncbi:hypothetical protein CERZMDRAFT_99807 [Cercospora zeae-maydis SCOH1-5]|uniref:Uncharacterized protein n=1 Tax=Cercospora zeae-maydis SCOH1-5 TaxID=717836 RepID=A0A6A6F9V6_9PEZI|nr:hypothetical protein CERZMDRAFT_99807 [Cercospora zeae-maydis SCOH1-5]